MENESSQSKTSLRRKATHPIKSLQEKRKKWEKMEKRLAFLEQKYIRLTAECEFLKEESNKLRQLLFRIPNAPHINNQNRMYDND